MPEKTGVKSVSATNPNSPLRIADGALKPELEVGDVKKYCASLLSYLSTSQNSYIDTVTSTNQFTDQAESALKEAISECKSTFLKS